MPPGRLADVAARAEVSLTVVRPYLRQALPMAVCGLGGLVVLGGRAGAYEDAIFPWLSDVKTLIAMAVIEGVPLLCVGLGHQLATVALGGQVTLNPHGPQRGVLGLRLSAAGRADPLFATLPILPSLVHWNDHVVSELPPAAVTLGHCDDGSISAVRFGEVAWGLQGHPEVTSALFPGWTGGIPARGRVPVRPRIPSALVRARHLEKHLERTWSPLLSAFIGLAHRHGVAALARCPTGA